MEKKFIITVKAADSQDCETLANSLTKHSFVSAIEHYAQLRLSAVVGQSEQLVCLKCGCESYTRTLNRKNICQRCGEDWAN